MSDRGTPAQDTFTFPKVLVGRGVWRLGRVRVEEAKPGQGETDGDLARVLFQNIRDFFVALPSYPLFIEGLGIAAREPPNIKNSQRIRHETHLDRLK
eukprot:scaffold22545_cov126-Isochrysis_galbana.AAC.8